MKPPTDPNEAEEFMRALNIVSGVGLVPITEHWALQLAPDPPDVHEEGINFRGTYRLVKLD